MATNRKGCPHPARHVHPTFDPRFEICDLCHMTRPAPLPAPWIVAHDAEQPTPPPPALFDAVETRSVPARTSRRDIAERRATYTNTYAAMRARDEALLGTAYTPTPPLRPELATDCPKCAGKGTISDPTRRRCPRCLGARQVCRYIAKSA